MAEKSPGLPGVEGAGVAPKRIPAVDEAAAKYVKYRDRRQDATKKEVEAKTELLKVLHDHEAVIGRDEEHIMRYVFDDMQVILKPVGEELKVKAYVDPGAPE